MKASGIPGDIFTKLWVLQYYKFSLDVYLFRHKLLPALTEQLIRNKDTDFFNCVNIVGACLWDIKRKGYITDKEIKAAAAKLYKGAMLDSVVN